MLEPLPTFTEAAVGTRRELFDRVDVLIEFHGIPDSVLLFYHVEGGYRVTVHCQDVRAMCEALGVPLDWKYNKAGTRRHVSVILEGIEFSGSEECK